METNEQDYGIPDYMISGLRGYINEHRGVGHFLTYVLENDLARAIQHADSTNLKLLPNYVRYLHNEAPAACWGSKKKVKDWLKAK